MGFSSVRRNSTASPDLLSTGTACFTPGSYVRSKPIFKTLTDVVTSGASTVVWPLTGSPCALH